MKDEIGKYAQMGMAAMLPGMVRAVEIMQEQIDALRAQLGEAQVVKRRGRPRGPQAETGELNARGKPLKVGYWASLTAEERSAEMRRRKAKQDANAKAANHPRDPRHPNHEKWIANVRRSRKRAWAALGPKKQKAHIAKMLAAHKPSVKLVNGAEAIQ